MPSSGSVASELIISGTISIKPPMLIAATISTIIRFRLFSMVSWRIASLSLYAGSSTATGTGFLSLTVFQTL